MNRFLKSLTLFLVFLIGAGDSNAQCGGANFSVDKNWVCVPAVINLKAFGYPPGTKFEWDLGNGFIVGKDTVSALLIKQADMDISIRFSFPGGSKCVIVKKAYIKAREKRKPSLYVDKPRLCSFNDTVTLVDTTSGSLKRDWQIDNKFYPNGPKRMRVVFGSSFGPKGVFLTNTDSAGCLNYGYFDTATFLAKVFDIRYKANKYNGCAPVSVNFSQNIDTFGQPIKSIYWEFPKGIPSTSTSRNPTVSYNTTDSFNIMMTVESIFGCKYYDTFFKEITFATIPVFSLSGGKPVFCAGETIKYDITGYDARELIYNFNPPNVIILEKGINYIKVKYDNLGLFNLQLVYKKNGCTSAKSYNNIARVNGPLARFTENKTKFCQIPDSVYFTNNTKDTTAWTNTFKWIVADSVGNVLTTATTKQFSYKITSAKTLTVKLIVFGTNGCTDTLSKVGLLTYSPLKAKYLYYPNTICPGQVIKFRNLSFGGDTTDKKFYKWTFFAANGTSILANSGAKDTQMTFNLGGSYKVQLEYFNKKGCYSADTGLTKIKVGNPNIKLSISDSLVCKGATITLFADLQGFRKGGWDAWKITNIDSGFSDFPTGDTAQFLAKYPGKHSVTFIYKDTFVPNCVATYTYPFKIKVSGVKMTATADSLKGCNPFTTTFKATTDYDVNYFNTSTSVKYLWNIRPGDKGTFINPTLQNAVASFPKAFSLIKLNYTGKSGCVDSTTYMAVTSGVFGAFSKSAAGNCVGNAVQFRDQSLNSSGVIWKCDSPSVLFSPSKTTASPWVTFTKRGNINIYMISHRWNKCFDTLRSYEKGDKPSVKFYSPDTVYYCAPKSVTFIDTSTDVYTSNWYFGDGDSLVNQTNVAYVNHIYRKNAPYLGYSVKVIGKSYYGCLDTLVRNKYIKVIGPVADFSLDAPDSGCEPLLMKFKNNSIYYKQLVVDYGDGVTANQLLPHKYRVINKLLSPQKFNPKFALFDSLGCSDAVVSDDTIYVLKSPEVRFSTSTTRGCEPWQVDFKNFSTFYNDYWWDFDYDGLVDSKVPNPFYVYSKGIYSPTLIAKNVYGCYDTLTFKDSVKALFTPKAKMFVLNPFACRKDFVYFEDQTYYEIPMKKRNWDFGEQSDFFDTSTQEKTKYSYKNPFNKQARLIVMDKNGCTDSTTQTVQIKDTTLYPNNNINFITVQNFKDINLNWGKYTFGDFKSYSVFLDESFYTLKKYTKNQNDTNYLINGITDITKRSYCYTIEIEDSCDSKSKKFESHCTIDGSVTSPGPFKALLQWRYYIGWKDVKRYDIFRSENGSAFKLIGFVDGNDQEYLDSNLCNKNYCYYVEAVHPNEVFRSRSDSFCIVPKFILPTDVVTMHKTTVQPDNSTMTTWSPYVRFLGSSKYVLEKSQAGNNPIFFREVVNPWYRDTLVDVNGKGYVYQVKFKDHCGNYSANSAVAKTIHLKGNTANYTAQMTWNPYEYWYSGVKEYIVQLRQPDRTFNNIASNGPLELAYQSADLTKGVFDSVCYRVVAVKDTVTADSSFSNVACIVPSSVIYIPNSFSPNDDLKNEVFKPSILFIKQNSDNDLYNYSFEIFNRWGERIFYTNKTEEGWDGNVRGQKSPIGVYIYKVKAIGLDGVYHTINGNVTLIR